MKLVFPNSAHVTTREWLILKGGRRAKTQLKIRYGLVIHPNQGPVLIDTGYTQDAVTAPRRSLMLRLYSWLLSPKLRVQDQPGPVLARVGFTPADVKTIVVTHFHPDHIAGLRQFPNARFVVNGPAARHAITAPWWRTMPHGTFTELLPADFAARIVALEDLPQTSIGRDIFADGSLIAVALPGHAMGHFGVLIAQDPSPVFYAVDAHWLAKGMTEHRRPSRPATLILDDLTAFDQSLETVARFAAKGCVVFAHDPDTTPFDLLDDPK